MHSGVLYIVSTPIGNLEDITLRALRILQEVSIIAVEDTRHSMKLLNHYSIKKPLISCWSQKEKRASQQIISKLKEGIDIALITDAGTPGISDPGVYTIKEAIKEGINIVPVPGPTAFVTALSISGLNSDEFRFIGFLPAKKSYRIKKLQAVANETITLVFYEAPHRIVDCINDMLIVLGDRKAVIAKEITKIHEEFIRDSLSSLCNRLSSTNIAGEFVIIVEGTRPKEQSFDDAMLELKRLINEGLSRKEASKIVSKEFGLKSKILYDKSINHLEAD